MRKVGLFISLLLTLHFAGFAQLSEIDHIKRSINQITDSLKYVDALNRLGTLMYERNLDSSFTLTRQAREIANRHGYDQGKADAFTSLGTFFYFKGNLQLSLRYYNDAFTIYKDIKDSARVVQSMMNIANIYRSSGKSKRSQQWFDKAIKTGSELRNDSVMALVIWNYMFSYPEKFTIKEKEINIGKIKGIANRYKDKRMLLLADVFVANDLFKNGKRKEALALLGKTADLAVQNRYLFSVVHIFDTMGNMLRPDKPLEAAEMYKKALAITGKNEDLGYSSVMAEELTDLYTQLGDSVQAMFYLRKEANLYQERLQLHDLSNVDYLDYALKDEQVKSLDQRSRHQIILLIVVTISCLLVVAFLIVLRQNLGRTKKYNQQISSQNEGLKKALEALEQSQAENTRMLKVVAHDLRSPIAGIYSLSDLMMEEGYVSEENKEMLQLIKTSSKNSLQLVNEVLQMQFKTETLDKRPVELGELLQRCVSLLRSSADAKDQIINLHLQQITLMASGEKLWRVMSNLIANAIKFSPNEAVIEVGMEKRTDHVRIGVADEGIGIPVEIEDKIFEMFTEAKRPGTAGEEPFGLGLAISKQIVEAHGGKIWFERKADKGTLFLVEFPLN